MRRAIALFGIAAAAACGSLPDTGGGVVALEIRVPDTLDGVGCTSSAFCILPHGDSLTLRARALNLNGDSIGAAIVWTTRDTTLIGLDALRGVVTGLSDTGGTAHVQASVGTLRSSIISISLIRDTATTTGLRGPQ